MASSIRDYVSEGTNLTYSQLKERFGDPKQISAVCISEMETSEMLVHMNASRKIIKTLAVASAVALALWAGCIALCYANYQSDANGYAIVEVKEIARTTMNEGE